MQKNLGHKSYEEFKMYPLNFKNWKKSKNIFF